MQTSKRPIARHRSPVLPKLGNGLGADDVERLPFELRKLRWTSTRISIHCCSMTSANDSKMTPKSASRIASKIAQSSYKGSSEEVHRRYSEVRQLACQKVEARVADSDPRLQNPSLSPSEPDGIWNNPVENRPTLIAIYWNITRKSPPLRRRTAFRSKSLETYFLETHTNMWQDYIKPISKAAGEKRIQTATG